MILTSLLTFPLPGDIETRRFHTGAASSPPSAGLHRLRRRHGGSSERSAGSSSANDTSTRIRERAIEAYAKSLELGPNNPNVIADPGVIYGETAQYEKTIAKLPTSHAIDATHLPSLDLDMLYAQYLKDYDKAIKTWKPVIEIAPTAVQAAKAHSYIERVKPTAKPQ